jgi:hypothetical protein
MRQNAFLLALLSVIALAVIGCSENSTQPDNNPPTGLTVISSSSSPFTAFIADSAYEDARIAIAGDETLTSDEKVARWKSLYDSYIATGDRERDLAAEEKWVVEVPPGRYSVECESHGEGRWSHRYQVVVLEGKNTTVMVLLD